MAFSETFAKLLEGKSSEHRKRFDDVVQNLEEFLDYDSERIAALHEYIEQNIDITRDDVAAYGHGISLDVDMSRYRNSLYRANVWAELKRLFAEDKKMGMNHGMLTASDFFICFRYPEGTFRQEELEELYVILYMERQENPPSLTFVVSKQAEKSDLYIAVLG